MEQDIKIVKRPHFVVASVEDPKGICPKYLEVMVGVDGTILDYTYKGGCDGNLKAIGRLIVGQNANLIGSLLKGNICNGKATSCADVISQLCLEAIKNLD